jgi:stage II sporulation protein D
MVLKLKAVLVIALSVCILSTGIIYADTEVQTPDTVKAPDIIKVGLFYGDSAASTFNVSAHKGLQFGNCIDDKFNLFYEDSTSDIFLIRKDSFFTVSKNVFTEYDPINVKNIPKGDKIGAFHIQIGKDYADFKSASKQAEDLKQKGIDAYPAYNDKWQVWTGFFINMEDAETCIENALNKKLETGEYIIINPIASSIVADDKDNKTLFLYAGSKETFRIHPKTENDPAVFLLNKKSYRGDIEVLRNEKSDMTVIDILTMNQYLYGVLPYEIEADSNKEALKAQAVVSRTFALNSLGMYSKWGFDLDPTTRCQVYKGFDEENTATNKAVDDTEGLIVTYKGKTAEVFFFASSGGRTEDVKNLWGESIPYLVSVEDKYEPEYKWDYSLPVAKLKDITKGAIGDILSMTATKYSESGRAIELLITGTKDQKTYVGEFCRSIFGYSNVKSQMYNISTDADVFIKGDTTDPVQTQLGGMKIMTKKGLKELKAANNKITVLGADGVKKTIPAIPTVYNFKGQGYGHGVGMSQNGAKGMAKAGFTFDQIVEYYFTGTKVEKK